MAVLYSVSESERRERLREKYRMSDSARICNHLRVIESSANQVVPILFKKLSNMANTVQ